MVWAMRGADMIWRLKEGLSKERVDGKMSQGEDLLVKGKRPLWEWSKKNASLATACGLEEVGREEWLELMPQRQAEASLWRV